MAWSMEEGRACVFFTQNFTVVIITEQRILVSDVQVTLAFKFGSVPNFELGMQDVKHVIQHGSSALEVLGDMNRTRNPSGTGTEGRQDREGGVAGSLRPRPCLFVYPT